MTRWILAPLLTIVFITGCVEMQDDDRPVPVREAIAAGAAPVAPYSPAIRFGDMVWVAGQIGRDPATGELGTTTADQTRFAMDSVGEILDAAGYTFNDVVQVQVFLADLNDFTEMNEAYAPYFDGAAPPARAAFEVSRLPLDARVEILVTAAKRR